MHVMLPKPGDNTKTKAPATLAQAAATYHTTTTNSSAAPDEADSCWSKGTMWALFALGWVIAPCWWIGVAAGLKTGGPKQCLLKRRRGLSRGDCCLVRPLHHVCGVCCAGHPGVRHPPEQDR